MSVSSVSQPNATAQEQLAQRFRQEAQSFSGGFAAALATATGTAASAGGSSSSSTGQGGAIDGIEASLPNGITVGVFRLEAPDGGTDGGGTDDPAAGQQMAKTMEELVSALDPGATAGTGTTAATGTDAASSTTALGTTTSQQAVHPHRHHVAAGAYGQSSGASGTASDSTASDMIA